MTNDIMGWGALSQPKGGAGDQIIYYRRPRKGEDAGWIVWGDSISGSKLRDYVRRGFEPLMQYGVINSPSRDKRALGNDPEPGMTTEKYVWEAILSHPDGPAEFPVAQIIAYGWHRPDQCPVPDAYFPQLVGKKVREYTCPERCGRKPFIEVAGVGGVGSLRQHLRIMHGWDQANLQAYGERMGIDFNKGDVDELLIADVEYERPQSRALPQRQSVAEIETVGEGLTCEDCGQEFTGQMAAARIARHRKRHAVAV